MAAIQRIFVMTSEESGEPGAMLIEVGAEDCKEIQWDGDGIRVDYAGSWAWYPRHVIQVVEGGRKFEA